MEREVYIYILKWYGNKTQFLFIEIENIILKYKNKLDLTNIPLLKSIQCILQNQTWYV